MSQRSILKTKFLLGNEAIAEAALCAGVRFAASYPGTPASEILPAFFKAAEREGVKVSGGWMINEKVAFEASFSAAISGIAAMVSMKQVGLNVATDPLMSAAYMGVKAPFIVVSVDDPGPHSSQTEQDSRFHAMFAKIPVFDPFSPQDAYDLFFEAFNLSAEFGVPVMLRPVLRVSHSRQSVKLRDDLYLENPVFDFKKEPERWAAIPKFRFRLHKKLNEKLKNIAQRNTGEILKQALRFRNSRKIYIASGAMYAYAKDLGVEPLVRVKMPYPLSQELLFELCEAFDEIWVLEETYPVIELQLPERRKVRGKLSGDIPLEGEVDLECLSEILSGGGKKSFRFPEKKPRLCPGCGHRPVFYAIRKTFPQGIYPGDIGCYTLGVNLEAVDSFICMGSAVSMALGFSEAIENFSDKKIPVIATIGDSTFLHSGIPALIEAVQRKAKMVLVILDNHTTAMTGGQPVADVDFESLVKGCGVRKVEKVHAYDYKLLVEKLRDCWSYSAEHGVSVLIVDSPCMIYGKKRKKSAVAHVDEAKCVNCGICYEKFECPAIEPRDNKAKVLTDLCSGCGVCVEICPFGAISLFSGP